MKPLMPLISGLLIACLGCASALAAEKPVKHRAQVAKAPAGKAQKSASKNSASGKAKRSRLAATPTAALPTRVAPQGVALALSTNLIAPPPAPASYVPTSPAPAVTPPVYGAYVARSFGSGGDNPYLPKPSLPTNQAFAPIQAVPDVSHPVPASPELGNLFGSLSQAIPILPDSGQSILPSIKKVYPTGEKPLVVVSFKCPTEVLGVTPPTIKLLHGLVDLGMEGINKSDLLSFNLQQVCQ